MWFGRTHQALQRLTKRINAVALDLSRLTAGVTRLVALKIITLIIGISGHPGSAPTPTQAKRAHLVAAIKRATP